VLLGIMVVGHGLWLVAAWFFRSMTGEQSNLEPGKPCSQCGARYGVKQGRCVMCGAVPGMSPRGPRLRDELQTTIHHLKRLGMTGAITQQQCDELVAIIEAEKDQLNAGPQPRLETSPSIASRSTPLPQPTASSVAPLINAESEVVEAILV